MWLTYPWPEQTPPTQRSAPGFLTYQLTEDGTKLWIKTSKDDDKYYEKMLSMCAVNELSAKNNPGMEIRVLADDGRLLSTLKTIRILKGP